MVVHVQSRLMHSMHCIHVNKSFYMLHAMYSRYKPVDRVRRRVHFNVNDLI
jgi:hypothetical protein